MSDRNAADDFNLQNISLQRHTKCVWIKYREDLQNIFSLAAICRLKLLAILALLLAEAGPRLSALHSAHSGKLTAV